MTNEEKQDIAAECRRLIAEASKEGAGYRTVAKGKVAEIALAALTAQPVKLPDILSKDFHDYGGYFEYSVYESALKQSLREAGYEVQE